MRSNIRLLSGKMDSKIRTEKGISQEQLSLICGLHRTYLSDIERGSRNVSIDNIGKIADALNVPLKDLFDFSVLNDVYKVKEVLEHEN